MNNPEETPRCAPRWFRTGVLLAAMACGPFAALAADQNQQNPAPSQPMRAPPMGMRMMESEPMTAPGAHPMGSMEPGTMGSSEASLVRTLLPTVVNISSRKVYDEPGSPMNAAAPASEDSSRVITLSGSGFIVDPQGIIATNYHVIGGAFEIIITFSDGTRAPAKLIGATKIGDIAILKVDVGHKLPTVHWANSDQVQIGDSVIAIGNPLGIGMSVTSGIVSALNRDIMASPYDNFIQTDAPINHGNSGGPLFDMKGRVIGIDTAIYSPTSGSVGIGFAIPANDAQFVIGRLEKYGAVRPGWIGVSLQQVTPDIAEAIGMNEPVGSILSDITPGSPAEKAGLRVGDVIETVGGKPAPDTRAVMRDIAVVPGGTPVTIGFWRDGKQQELSVTVAEWPKAPPKLDKPAEPAALERPIPPNLGLQMAPFDDQARNKYGIDFDQPGVLVTSVARNTDAADRGMVAGDVILQVQDHQVSTPADVEQRLNEARDSKRRMVLLLIQPKLQPETQAQTAAMPGAKASPPTATGLQWGPPKWVALRISNG